MAASEATPLRLAHEGFHFLLLAPLHDPFHQIMNEAMTAPVWPRYTFRRGISRIGVSANTAALNGASQSVLALYHQGAKAEEHPHTLIR